MRDQPDNRFPSQAPNQAFSPGAHAPPEGVKSLGSKASERVLRSIDGKRSSRPKWPLITGFSTAWGQTPGDAPGVALLTGHEQAVDNSWASSGRTSPVEHLDPRRFQRPDRPSEAFPPGQEACGEPWIQAIHSVWARAGASCGEPVCRHGTTACGLGSKAFLASLLTSRDPGRDGVFLPWIVLDPRLFRRSAGGERALAWGQPGGNHG